MSKNLNEKLGGFEYSGRKYEVDRLLDSYDSMMGGYVYDLFDVTDDPKGDSVVQTGYADGMTAGEICEAFKDELKEINVTTLRSS